MFLVKALSENHLLICMGLALPKVSVLVDPRNMGQLHLFKQNFKFSSAHFLIFDSKTAEKLHGHNYQVRVDIQLPPPNEYAKRGYSVDFKIFKKSLKKKLDQWDEHVLLPEKHPEMKFNVREPSLEVTFRDRFYVFPLNEVVLLPIVNTSVEELSRLLAGILYREWSKDGIRSIRVSVEETRGQSASFRAPPRD